MTDRLQKSFSNLPVAAQLVTAQGWRANHANVEPLIIELGGELLLGRGKKGLTGQHISREHCKIVATPTGVVLTNVSVGRLKQTRLVAKHRLSACACSDCFCQVATYNTIVIHTFRGHSGGPWHPPLSFIETTRRLEKAETMRLNYNDRVVRALSFSSRRAAFVLPCTCSCNPIDLGPAC